MIRQDEGLAFMLNYDNIARFEDGKVYILDRRIYPAEVSFVCCGDYTQVAQALTDMVTQSAGPFTAAPMGMALAAYECRNMKAEEQKEYLRRASDCISHS